MNKPEIPLNEAQRLGALCSLDILDTPSEARFDRLTRVAQHHFQVPIALVSLIDADRQWFKSRQGLDAEETPRDISFCGHAILSEDIFYIPNALDDPRFADNPLVTGGPKIRFYAGAPLHSPDGLRIGTLCIIDPRPRQFSSEELSVLRDLADTVEAELERIQLIDAIESESSRRKTELQELARFKHVLDRTLDMIFMFEADSLQFVYLNQGAIESMGYSREELLQMHPYDIKPLLDEAQFRAFIAPLLSGQQDVLHFETVHRHKEGRDFPVEIFLQLVHEHGTAGRFIAIVRDISERKAMEATNKRYQAMIHSSDDSIMSKTLDGIITSWNPGAEEMFGYSAEEAIGQPMLMLFPPEREAEEQAILDKVARGERVEPFDTVRLRKDGSPVEISVTISPIVDDSGKIVGASKIARDIAERKRLEKRRQQAETELVSSENRLRAVIDTVVDGIVTIDGRGTVASFNPAAERIFGYEAGQVIGRNVNMLMPEPYAESHDGYLRNYLTTGERKIIGIGREVTGKRQDGSTFAMELAVSEMAIDGERMFTGIVRDITERKRLERMKSEFVSTVSHELRTPLTSIRGALDLVLGKAADQLPPKARKMLEMAARNAERLTLLINDILDLEKIESGRLEFEFSTLDLQALARRALEDNEGYAHRHEVRLELGASVPEARVHGDEHRLLQVFANLISNAVKYSPPGGQVEIGIEPLGEGFRASVRDHGRGIPEEFRSRIFQRFAQADSSDTREKGGTGLGLSITKAIVERHQGKIGYATEMGKGSLFHFDLPAVQAPDREAATRLTGPRVLICEDNADVATILAEMLEPEGVSCDIAGTAGNARVLLKAQDYRLMLLDLSLPDGDGLRFIQELRADPATAHLPVIVVSGRAEEGRQAFSGDGVMVVDWLQKPIDARRLERALRDALRRAKRPRILHVEDDPDIVQVIQALLEDLGDFSHVPSLREARQRLSQQHFDLAILDLGLADGSGLELLDELKGHCPVVIFSAQVPGQDVTRQVKAALTKSMTSNAELLATIKNILKG